MAILSAIEAKEIANSKVQHNKKFIEDAKAQEERMHLHTLAVNSKKDLPYYDKYLSKVKQIISPEKADVFDHLQSIPFETTELIEENFREIEKIFETQDRAVQHDFKNTENLDDFEKYLQSINNYTFWKTEGMSMLKSHINSYVVVDYPSLEFYTENGLEIPQKTEPYYYTVYIKGVLSVQYKKNSTSELEYIAFRDPYNQDQVNIFDDRNIFVFVKAEKETEYQLKSATEHEFKKCPVTPFYHQNFSKENKVQKEGLATKLISSLEWLSIRITMSKHAELYSGFPITTSYEEECNYQDPQGAECDNGILRYEVRKGVGSDEVEEIVKDCPACNNNNNLGAGTHKIAPARADKDDPDMLEAVKFVQIPVEQLKRLEESIEAQKKNISSHMIGKVKQVENQSINESQVYSGYEERKSVLDQVKRNLEQTEKFVIERMGEVRYPNDYSGTYLNYGTKYFLFTAEELSSKYIEYKDAGMPEYILDGINQEIVETKYKTDKQGKTRSLILQRLLPYPHYNISQLRELYQIDSALINKDMLDLKVNFSQYLSRLESEYTEVEKILPMQDFNIRIEFIKSKLEQYATDSRKQRERPEVGAD